MSECKKFFASLDHLHEMLTWILSKAKTMGFQGKELHQLELASEEALVNIIHYAYADRGGEIEMSISATPSAICIEICDQGKFFNPLKFEPTKNQNKPLVEREVGGLGIQLMRQCLDELLYTRKGEKNSLTLIKKLWSEK